MEPHTAASMLPLEGSLCTGNALRLMQMMHPLLTFISLEQLGACREILDEPVGGDSANEGQKPFQNKYPCPLNTVSEMRLRVVPHGPYQPLSKQVTRQLRSGNRELTKLTLNHQHLPSDVFHKQEVLQKPRQGLRQRRKWRYACPAPVECSRD